jgi:hypothetical protein
MASCSIEIAPILVYVIGLVTMLALSAACNMWPVLPAKWVLRRFDHSAIYLLIAGTYTPFLAMKNVLASAGLGSRELSRAGAPEAYSTAHHRGRDCCQRKRHQAASSSSRA